MSVFPVIEVESKRHDSSFYKGIKYWRFYKRSRALYNALSEK